MTKVAGCGDPFGGEACLDGIWYGYCGAAECSGFCADQGMCPCIGCDRQDCCARDEQPKVAEPQ